LGLDPEGVVIEVAPREGEYTLRTEDIISAIEKNKDELALVLFSGLNYYTGQVFDMPAITKAGQKAGAIVGFDLAHAAGNIPLHLHDWNVDFACWCNYKYLNAGPGAIGGVYIHERYHTDSSIHRFAGWWGYEKETRFQMAKGFQPIQSAEGWQLSTPSLLLYASLKASLTIFEEARIDRLHAKRMALTSYLWQVLKSVNESTTVPQIKFITPEDESARGCQISMLMLSNGKAIYDALMEKGFFVDWREPDVIRLAPVPLYNRFEEVWRLGEELRTP
jgi:kynureninase